MKLAIIYHSESGNTKRAAELIKEGMEKVEGVEVKLYSIADEITDSFDDVCGVMFGAPTYYAQISWQMLKFMETSKINLSDKLGCAFSTANVEQGGSELVLDNLNNLMLAKGMTVFSGGVTHGTPFTHVGANAFAKGTTIDARKEVLAALGEKFAKKAVQYFG